MTTINTLISYLERFLTVLISGLTTLVTKLVGPQIQSHLTVWIRALNISRCSTAIVNFSRNIFSWLIDAKGFRANRFAQVSVVILIVIIVYQYVGGKNINDLKQSGELVVISRESDSTWYEDQNGMAGPEYDYLNSFAEYLGVKLRFDNRDSNAEILDAITESKGHLAAAGLTRDPWLEQQGIIFGPEYQAVDQQVVCRRNHGSIPRTLDDLIDKELVVIEDSSQEARLFTLQEDYPDLSWESVDDVTGDELLELVWRKEIECTIANSHVVNIKRRLYPELEVGFTLQENLSLAWTLSPEWEFLSDAIETWLDKIERDGTLLILKDKHFTELKFDYVDMRSFIRRIKSRMPRLMPMFEEAAEKYGMPWTLLAAQAYQESHWNRRAKSPTGVRGIMMLTLVTAKEMGVESRLDARQSIMGGARYLKKLEARIPEAVTGDDRWWFALAAYNVGMGHVYDARKLASSFELDADSWLDLKGVLPLLAQKKYYKDLKYGFARGAEPVTYVSKIRNYENILRAQLAKTRGAHAS